MLFDKLGNDGSGYNCHVPYVNGSYETNSEVADEVLLNCLLQAHKMRVVNQAASSGRGQFADSELRTNSLKQLFHPNPIKCRG